MEDGVKDDEDEECYDTNGVMMQNVMMRIYRVMPRKSIYICCQINCILYRLDGVIDSLIH